MLPAQDVELEVCEEAELTVECFVEVELHEEDEADTNK